MVYESPQKKRGREALGQKLWGGTFEESDYPRGSLKRIRLENFMTYKEAMVYPGPRLNLVLGPNGSGKSSIVCAVGMCLCASMKRLGRATDPKDYVRKGAKSALIELIVSGGPDHADYRIQRDLSSDGSRSTFKINGLARTQKDVEALNKELNIQLDNLCQFLPQEKVVEFSKMTPTELLLSTERAIGDGQLACMHERLINGGKELDDRIDMLGNVQRQLEMKVIERDEMAKDVEKIKEHDDLRCKSDACRARAAQLLAEAAEEVYTQKQEEHDEAKAREKALKECVLKRDKPRARMRKELEALRKEEADAEKAANAADNAIKDTEDAVEEAQEALKGYQADIANLDKKEATRQRDLEANRQLHKAVLDKLDAMPAAPPGVDVDREGALTAQKQQLTAQLNTAGRQREKAEYDLGGLEPQREHLMHVLQRKREVQQRRVQTLERKYRGIGTFYSRVLAMRRGGAFQGHVYGPVATEVRVKPGSPPHAAAAIENTIPQRVMAAFVVDTDRDRDLLRGEAQQMQVDRAINVIVFKGDPLRPIHRSPLPAEALAGTGALAPLDTLFDAPPIVKHVLCDQAGLVDTLLIDDDRNADKVFSRCESRLLYGPRQRHSKTVSRYNAQAAMFASSDVRRVDVLGEETDRQGIEAAEAELRTIDGRRAAFASTIEQLSQEVAKLEEDRGVVGRELDAMHLARQRHAQDLAKTRQKAAKLERDIQRDESAAPLLKKPAVEKKITALHRQQKTRLEKLLDKVTDSLEKQCKGALATASRIRVQAELIALEDAHVQGKADLSATAALVRQLADELQATRLEHERCSKDWKDNRRAFMARRSLPEAAALRELAEVPGEDAVALLDEADEQEARAERIAVSGDRGMLQRYQKLVRDIEAQQATVDEQSRHTNRLKEELAEARATWLPSLRAKVEAISVLFSENFKRIGSVGEVGLHEAGEDYAAYAVNIRVKFRDASPLESLSPSRHSGGEKSVSTIMFLLSLQRSTSTPFRVVDEINQGMDQTNERKVFQAMVDAATERHTAQCLLMTPKLLPQLEYSEHVNVLAIQNGTHIQEVQRQLVPSKQARVLLGTHAPAEV